MAEDKKPVLLLEASLGKQLEKYVGDCIDRDPLWCSKFLKTNKEACIQVHRDFINAGADFVKTITYQASVEGFKKYLGLDEEKSLELFKESVSNVREAIQLELGDDSKSQRKVFIVGAVGPYGAGLHDGSEYRGEYVENTSATKMIAYHKPRIEALLEAGVDVLAIETIPAFKEAEVLLNLLKQYPKAKAWLTFSTKDDEHISYGEKLSDVAARCWSINSEQLLAMGVNCLHPKNVTPLLTSIRKVVPDVPLIAYPNSGEIYNVELEQWEGKEKCVPLVDYLSSWLELGIYIIGSCCRTDAETTRQFRREIDNWLQNERKSVRSCNNNNKKAA